MQRWSCGVSYLGTRYHGWQKQPLLQETIEQKLQEAFEAVADGPCVLCCAGRTDKGVHATGQVIHFDSDKNRTSLNWLGGVNRLLPEDIKLQWALPVGDNFHARFSARSRSYCYVIYQNEVSHPLLNGRVWWIRKNLDGKVMQEAANHWLGEFDFSSFRDSDCQARHPIRRLINFKVVTHGHFCVFYVEANAFLHHMIRNMMGVLVEIGLGKRKVSWALDVLKAKDRSKAGITAPAQGLYLCQVRYELPWAKNFPHGQDPFKLISL